MYSTLESPNQIISLPCPRNIDECDIETYFNQILTVVDIKVKDHHPDKVVLLDLKDIQFQRV